MENGTWADGFFNNPCNLYFDVLFAIGDATLKQSIHSEWKLLLLEMLITWNNSATQTTCVFGWEVYQGVVSNGT